MSVTEQHLDAVKRAMQGGDAIDRKLLRECLYELSTSVSRRLVTHAVTVLQENHREPVVEEEDLLVVDQLVALGVQQNGLVPVLSTLEVGRALAVVSGLLIRASVSQLEQHHMELLEAVFDHAAEHEEVTAQVRELETRVRGGLGLDQRIAWPTQELPLS